MGKKKKEEYDWKVFQYATFVKPVFSYKKLLSKVTCSGNCFAYRDCDPVHFMACRTTPTALTGGDARVRPTSVYLENAPLNICA